MTTLYLAFSLSGSARETYKALAQTNVSLNLLVAFPFLKGFHNLPEKPLLARTMLDSGAFSAWQSNVIIDIDALIAETKKDCWQESVCLDVIGDPESSLKNALYMKEQGSPAYPVFHFGDPFEILKEYCNQFSKVGLSCRLGEPVSRSLAWLDECFCRQYPHRFHSFGWTLKSMLMRYPFHSADTASWNNGTSRFGNWKAFPGMRAGPRGVVNLRAEVEFYFKLERELQQRWKQEMSRFN